MRERAFTYKAWSNEVARDTSSLPSLWLYKHKWTDVFRFWATKVTTSLSNARSTQTNKILVLYLSYWVGMWRQHKVAFFFTNLQVSAFDKNGVHLQVNARICFVISRRSERKFAQNLCPKPAVISRRLRTITFKTKELIFLTPYSFWGNYKQKSGEEIFKKPLDLCV